MIAIKRNNGAVYWLDAVLSFTESYSSTVTKHQIEDGSSISDHIISDNAKFTISGVVSGCEYATGVTMFDFPSDEAASLTITSQPNSRDLVTPLLIGSSQSNPLIKLLPDSIRQFVGDDSPPEVYMGTLLDINPSFNTKEEFKKFVNGFPVIDGKGNEFVVKETVTIIEFDSKFKHKQIYENCVCTSLSFNETPDSGDAVYPEMSFEQVRFVKLLKTKLPTSVASSIKNQSSEKVTKGNQPAKEETTSPKTVGDPAKDVTDQKGAAREFKSSAADIKDAGAARTNM